MPLKYRRLDVQINFTTTITRQKSHTNDAVEQTNSDNGRDRPERVPPQDKGILKNANHTSGREKEDGRVDVLL